MNLFRGLAVIAVFAVNLGGGLVRATEATTTRDISVKTYLRFRDLHDRR